MRTRLLLSIIAVVCVLPVWASEPGQPLDCSDWIVVEPGLAIVTYEPHCGCCTDPLCGDLPWVAKTLDNEGQALYLRWFRPAACGGSDIRRYEVVRRFHGTQTVLAYLEERCVNGNIPTRTVPGSAAGGVPITDHPPSLFFDPVEGNVLLWFIDEQSEPQTFSYVCALQGLPSLFDVLQSYVPVANSWGFRVPTHPEGLRNADHFDTYWGDLSTVGNWSQAHGLQCNYPAAQPHVGDYLTAADTLPTPQPGHGYYYVTAATYQGQTRYGRKTSGGRLSGRDPTLLPVCAQ